MKKFFKEIIKYILWFILFLVLFVLMSGCSSVTNYLKEANELYERPCYRGDDRISPRDMASYYTTNYPDVSDNDKAVMLYNRLKNDKWEVILEEKEVIVKEKIVLWNGIKIWPINNEIKEEISTVDSLQNSLKQTAEDLDELGDRFKKKETI